MFGWNAMQTPPSHQANVGGQVLPDEFGTEPLLGYRGWHIVNAGDGTGFALKSLHASHLWDREVEAVCLQAMTVFYKGRYGGHRSPDPACSCGIYAQLPEHPLSEWDDIKVGRVSASGTIAMWGRIIRCERGFKAQYARIESPIVLDMSCVRGCDGPPNMIALPDMSQRGYLAYCPQHAYDVQSPLVRAELLLPEISNSLSRRYDIEVLTWI